MQPCMRNSRLQRQRPEVKTFKSSAVWMYRAETCLMLQCVPGRAADKPALELSERLSLVPHAEAQWGLLGSSLCMQRMHR